MARQDRFYSGTGRKSVRDPDAEPDAAARRPGMLGRKQALLGIGSTKERGTDRNLLPGQPGTAAHPAIQKAVAAQDRGECGWVLSAGRRFLPFGLLTAGVQLPAVGVIGNGVITSTNWSINSGARRVPCTSNF